MKLVGVRVFFLFIASFFFSPFLQAKIIVSAASSLQEALETVIKVYKGKNNSADIVLNTGASGVLAQQIILGANVDVFISASLIWTEHLQKKGFLKKKPSSFIANKLVLANSCDNNLGINSIGDLVETRGQKIVVADFDYAPLGWYTKKYLQDIKFFELLRPKLIFANSAAQTRQYLKLGLVDLGFIYYSDAFLDKNICIIKIIDTKIIGAIYYQLAETVLQDSVTKLDFIKFLQSEEAIQKFIEYGFFKIN